MKVKALKVFKDRNYQLVALFSFVTLATFSFNNFYSNKTNKMMTIDEGMNTCFNRLNQSFTARMLGDKGSIYLEKNFTSQTEECFSDVIAYSENIVQASDQKMFGKFNTLSREAFWFNQKISGEDKDFSKNPEGVILSSLTSRFQKIENKFSEISEFITNTKSNYKSSYEFTKIATFVSFFILLFQSIFTFINVRRFAEANERIENQSAELSKSGNLSLSKSFSIVKNALKQNQLDNTNHLFEKTVALLNIEGVQTKNVVEASSKVSEQEVENIWQESEAQNTGHNADNVAVAKNRPETPIQSFKVLNQSGVRLEDVITKCFDSLSSKIFTTGTKINIEGNEDVRINVDSEELEQALYHSLLASINLGSTNIDVNSKRLGGSVMIEVKSNGTRLPKEFLIGHKNNYARPSSKYMDLFVTKEIVKELGTIKFENTSNDENAFVITMSFEASEVRRVVNVEKTTKKDLLERIKQFRV